MAFKAFQTDSQADDRGLPWSEEYVSDNPHCIGMAFDVVSIRLTQKGMMIATSVSKAFIYKSHHTYGHVIDFLVAWGGKKTPSPLLQVQLTTSRPFIVLGVDDERNGMWSEKTEESWRQAYSTVADRPPSPANPLPMPSRPGISVLSDAPANTSTADSRGAYLPQTSTDLPLAEPGGRVNGVKGRNTRSKK